MSGVVDILVLPPLLPTIAAGGPAFGALLGASAAGYAVYAAFNKLHQDYQVTLSEFHERSAETQEQRRQQASKQQTATTLAVMLAEQTNVSAVENATTTFLREHALELAQHIAELPNANQALLEQCQTLLQAIDTTPGEVKAHFDAYDQLFDAFTSETKKGGDVTAINSATASALAILRQEIASPLLALPECADTRDQLFSQLQTVEALAESRQASVAVQALTLLRQRVNRELREQAERLQVRAHEQQAMRKLVGDILAKLQAISQLTMLPEFCQRAQSLLTQLQTELAQPSADNLSALQQIGQQVDNVFTACEKALQENFLAAYVGDSVTDVLYSLGYRVSQISPDEDADSRTCVAAYDDSVGVQFHVDGDGHLKTELVALDAGAAEVDRGKQEKVCSMIDQVLDALKQRDCQVRERYRSNFEDNEQLRVVELPTAESRANESASPKMMRIDES